MFPQEARNHSLLTCWQVVDLENHKPHSQPIFQILLIFLIILRDITQIQCLGIFRVPQIFLELNVQQSIQVGSL